MKRYFLLITGLFSIWVTAYFSLLPLADVTQADISGKYPTIITPTSMTFSIWSLIYFSWLILGSYAIFIPRKLPYKNVILFITTQLLSVLWLIPWHYDIIPLSFVVMLSIIWILFYLALYPTKDVVFQSIIYLFFGWILVATLANFHVFLLSVGMYTNPEMLWVLSLIVWASVNYYFYKYHHTIIPSLVFLWALFWIMFLQNNSYIVITSISGIVFILSYITLFFIHKR